MHGTGLNLVRSGVEFVLGTKCADPLGVGGEIPWRQEFGSRIGSLRHRNMDEVTKALARYYARDAMSRWEPRVAVGEIDIQKKLSSNELSLRVAYELISEDSPDNLVTVPRDEAEVIA